MNAVVILLVGIAILVAGYIFYGGWLTKQWGVGEGGETPAHTMEDGKDYVPAKTPVLMGHHFSSIAGAGPINGPIQAAVFGWVPVMLWVLLGGIFIGATHDYGALFASVRNKGQSIGEVIENAIGIRAKRLFIIFSYLTLILVVAAFASIVANTFKATYDESGALDMAASAANASTAMISLLFILVAVAFGLLVYRRNAPLGVSTVIGVAAIILCMAIGLNWHPIYFDGNTWMVIVGIYIAIASVTPVWILLQPRDYLSSFLLYGMMAVAIVGIIGAHPTLEIPAFTSFKDPATYGSGVSLGYMFPSLFVTIACGAISGFHSLVASGTTSKQLDAEKEAKPIAYGSMLIECALALISLCAVGYIWSNYKAGGITTPTAVFASGISQMCAEIPFLKNAENVIYSLLILAVSAFCLTSLDTATRLSRYMFQEFWLAGGERVEDVTGFRKVLVNPYVATGITVVAGIALGMTGYAKIWALFGAANQLLAALGLLAVAAWLGTVGKNNKMFLFPMAFMLVVTVVSLIQTIITNVTGMMAGGSETVWMAIRAILAFLLVVLSLVLTQEGVKTIFAKKAAK